LAGKDVVLKLLSSRNNRLATIIVAVGFLGLTACNRSPQSGTAEAKQYSLKGTVVSIDKPNSSLVVNGEAIPGFMDAMAMPYKVKNASELDPLAVGDSIAATIVGEKDDYFVRDITVTAHSSAAPAKPFSDLHIPEPGESVPNFRLVNQNGRHISLDQYRGKTLLVTFIYTRCPFADFCPRVSGEFATLNQELKKNAGLYKKTHLLSVSFDPKNDTPKVLRTYGAGYLGEKAPQFDHWEFAAPAADQLPDLAKYFGLTYTEEGGVITHSLSTAVIGPDGKIVKWYHGTDWKASDLLKDATDAVHPAG
jgi:protein SCO1/2